jgi:uncharacterized protein YpmB
MLPLFGILILVIAFIPVIEMMWRKYDEPAKKSEGDTLNCAMNPADVKTGYYVAMRRPLSAESQPEIVWVGHDSGDLRVFTHHADVPLPMDRFFFIEEWKGQ